jgi:hypothetical protein
MTTREQEMEKLADKLWNRFRREELEPQRKQREQEQFKVDGLSDIRQNIQKTLLHNCKKQVVTIMVLNEDGQGSKLRIYLNICDKNFSDLINEKYPNDLHKLDIVVDDGKWYNPFEDLELPVINL